MDFSLKLSLLPLVVLHGQVGIWDEVTYVVVGIVFFVLFVALVLRQRGNTRD